jgi:hypothetical protein
MDEEKKKKIMIAVLVSCIVLAGAITFLTREGGGGGGGSSNAPIQLLCMNEECSFDFEMTSEEYREQMMQGGMMGPGPMAQTPVECSECGMQSAFRGIKCNECELVFMQDYTSGDFPDRCPECDYSEIEARREGN